MRQFFINWFCSFGFGLVFATCAIGQPANQSPPKPVEALLKVFLIGKNAEGKEVRLAADKASPGDVLEYQTVYQNNGKATVKLLTATLPLPIGVGYVAGSAKPINAQASVDGKVFSDMPLKTMVKSADGKVEERLVPYSDYRALRWNLGALAATEKMTVSARTQIISVSGSTAAVEKTK